MAGSSSTRAGRPADAVADPDGLAREIAASGPLDMVVGPSGYGLPVSPAATVSDDDLRLAFLSRPGDPGGIGGIGRLARSLGQSGLPMVFIPGIVHLDTVPRHRKLNRVDLGTADKVSATALAIAEQSKRRGRRLGRCLADPGRAGGRLYRRHRGASRADRRRGGRHGRSNRVALFRGVGRRGRFSRRRSDEGGPLSGWSRDGLGERSGGARDGDRGVCRRHRREWSRSSCVRRRMPTRSCCPAAGPQIQKSCAGSPRDSRGPRQVRPLAGFASVAKEGAQGAALIADGLAGGTHRDLVERLRLRKRGGNAFSTTCTSSLPTRPAAAWGSRRGE